jgi:hypothetical protein
VTVPQPHGVSCPNCGAPVRFLWAQAVQTTCAYCRSVLVRRDLDLAKLGQQADFPATGSPIQIGTEGTWHDQSVVVIGRIAYGWARGKWNEWHCVLADGTNERVFAITEIRSRTKINSDETLSTLFSGIELRFLDSDVVDRLNRDLSTTVFSESVKVATGDLLVTRAR